MRLYVAGPWKCKEQVKAAAQQFESAGHTIVEKWWEHREVDMGDLDAAEELSRQAKIDYLGVLGAQHFIFLNLAYSEGKCVELGIALAEGTPILAVGERGLNVFHYLPQLRWVRCVEEAIEYLRRK